MRCWNWSVPILIALTHSHVCTCNEIILTKQETGTRDHMGIKKWLAWPGEQGKTSSASYENWAKQATKCWAKAGLVCQITFLVSSSHSLAYRVFLIKKLLTIIYTDIRALSQESSCPSKFKLEVENFDESRLFLNFGK